MVGELGQLVIVVVCNPAPVFRDHYVLLIVSFPPDPRWISTNIYLFKCTTSVSGTRCSRKRRNELFFGRCSPLDREFSEFLMQKVQSCSSGTLLVGEAGKSEANRWSVTECERLTASTNCCDGLAVENKQKNTQKYIVPTKPLPTLRTSAPALVASTLHPGRRKTQNMRSTTHS